MITKGMYDKEFKINNNGVQETIIIKPLATRYLPKLFKILKKFNEQNMEGITEAEATNIMIDSFAESDVLIHLTELLTETVKKSYPDMDPVTIDEFVGANMFQLLPLMIEVNFKKNG